MRIVILYAPADRPHRDTLVKYLKPLDIELWDENELTFGVSIDKQVEAQMNFADFVLVLVSPDSISDPTLLAQLKSLHNGQKVCLVPVLLKSSLWDETVLKGLKPLPLDGQPILGRAVPAEERFFQVANTLKGAFFGFGDADEAGFQLPRRIGFPKIPFPGPNWFGQEDARIFFGRGQEVKDFLGYFEDVDPVILLYGESGVGKSSFLRAGMLPRLEEQFEVRVHPRTKSAPLYEQLEQEVAAFKGTKDRQVLILDQVEEIYTNPRQDRLDEEERFARTLRQVIQKHPDLKIVLSFRKEYFVEIRKLLDGASIDYLEKRLVALDRAGVLEAITGLTKTASAQRKYRLKIESNVPFKIANDILGGDSAHIATFLQILLRKMWKAVVDEEERIFSEDLYAQLRSASFEELIDRQIQKIQEVFPEQESSGLVLAVLQACTTEYGTAGAQFAKDLKEQYAHVKDFEALLEQLQQSLLLTYLSTTDEYRLPHDSLAPLIIKRFLKSDRPVQRAVRLLENAVSSQTGLSKDAYLLVKEARPWCRRFTTVEVQLLEQGGKRFFKETLKAWLQNNEVDRVLRNLEEKIIELNDLELFQQVAMYAFRYHSLTRDWYRGWITQNDYHIGHNLIVNGLEGFINDLKLFDFTRVEHQFLEALLEGDLKSALGLLLQGAEEYGMGTDETSRALYLQKSRLNQILKAIRENTMSYRDVLMSLSHILEGILDVAYESIDRKRLNLLENDQFREVYAAFGSGNANKLAKEISNYLQSKNLEELQRLEKMSFLRNQNDQRNKLAHDLLIEIGRLHAQVPSSFLVQNYTGLLSRISDLLFSQSDFDLLMHEQFEKDQFFQMLLLSFQKVVIGDWKKYGALQADEVQFFEDRLAYASEAVGKEIMYWNSSQNDSSPTVEDIIENFCAGELLEGILKTNLYSSSNTLEREVENQLIFDLSSLVQVHRNFYIGLLPVEGIIKQLYNLLKTLKSLQPSNIVSSPSESPIEAFELQHLDKKRLFGLLKPLVSNLQADLEYTYLKALDQSITAFFPKAEAERKLWDNRIRHALIALGKVLRSNSPTETDGAGSDLVMEEFMLEIKEVLSKADFSLAIERIRMVVDRVPIFNQFSKELLLLEGRYQALSQNERLLFTLVHDQQGEQRSRLLYQLLEFVQKLADHYQKEMT